MPARLGHLRQNHVSREELVAGEVDARVDLSQQPASKEAHVDVRGLRLPCFTRHPSGANRFERARSIRASRQPAKAAKPFRRENVLRIGRANISALGVGLPQLDQGVRQRRTVAVEDANLQAYPAPGVSGLTRQPSVALSARPK